MDVYTFGINVLDKLYGGILRPGSTILIAGLPGSGKTILASHICYNNSIRNYPCLYVSFSEHRDKYIEYMKSFNMDFDKLEIEGLFKYLKLPLIPSVKALDNFIELITENALKLQARVIVIDGITPLLSVMKELDRARSFLQTTLYEIPRLLGGLLVLVADLPELSTDLGQTGIEYVADLVLLLRYKAYHNIIQRFIEVKKIR
ncbi:MAG: hypothetical protein J7K21_03300, partial [Desulfurococcales archaeon]|nr:hypothetical protein [Desulfurococcales archaeon]